MRYNVCQEESLMRHLTDSVSDTAPPGSVCSSHHDLLSCVRPLGDAAVCRSSRRVKTTLCGGCSLLSPDRTSPVKVTHDVSSCIFTIVAPPPTRRPSVCGHLPGQAVANPEPLELWAECLRNFPGANDNAVKHTPAVSSRSCVNTAHTACEVGTAQHCVTCGFRGYMRQGSRRRFRFLDPDNLE